MYISLIVHFFSVKKIPGLKDSHHFTLYFGDVVRVFDWRSRVQTLAIASLGIRSSGKLDEPNARISRVMSIL